MQEISEILPKWAERLDWRTSFLLSLSFQAVADLAPACRRRRHWRRCVDRHRRRSRFLDSMQCILPDRLSCVRSLVSCFTLPVSRCFSLVEVDVRVPPALVSLISSPSLVVRACEESQNASVQVEPIY